jgi:hypothetical protein
MCMIVGTFKTFSYFLLLNRSYFVRRKNIIDLFGLERITVFCILLALFSTTLRMFIVQLRIVFQARLSP